jgi:hypothetical protein
MESEKIKPFCSEAGQIYRIVLFGVYKKNEQHKEREQLHCVKEGLCTNMRVLDERYKSRDCIKRAISRMDKQIAETVTKKNFIINYSVKNLYKGPYVTLSRGDLSFILEESKEEMQDTIPVVTRSNNFTTITMIMMP